MIWENSQYFSCYPQCVVTLQQLKVKIHYLFIYFWTAETRLLRRSDVSGSEDNRGSGCTETWDADTWTRRFGPRSSTERDRGGEQLKSRQRKCGSEIEKVNSASSGGWGKLRKQNKREKKNPKQVTTRNEPEVIHGPSLLFISLLLQTLWHLFYCSVSLRGRHMTPLRRHWRLESWLK